MSQILMLDTLYPPPPDQLARDIQSVGASGVFAYVYRPGGTGNWTPFSVATLRALRPDFHVVPILVPLPNPDTPEYMLSVTRQFGFNDGPIVLDLEPPNLPPAAWEEQFDAAARAQGFTDLDYGTPSNLGLYQPDDENWIATWIRTGTLNPVPPLPAGWKAWQFVNDVNINGTLYDVSVVDDVIFPAQSAVVIPIGVETMPAEIVSFVRSDVSDVMIPLDLGGVYNCQLTRVYVSVRDSHNTGKLTGRVVQTGRDGTPIDSHDFAVSTPGGYDEWALPVGPAAKIGHLVLQTVSAPCTVTVKVGNL